MWMASTSILIEAQKGSKTLSCVNLLKKPIALGIFSGYIFVQKENASEAKVHLVLREIKC